MCVVCVRDVCIKCNHVLLFNSYSKCSDNLNKPRSFVSFFSEKGYSSFLHSELAEKSPKHKSAIPEFHHFFFQISLFCYVQMLIPIQTVLILTSPQPQEEMFRENFLTHLAVSFVLFRIWLFVCGTFNTINDTAKRWASPLLFPPQNCQNEIQIHFS